MNEDKFAAGWNEAAYGQLLALRQNVADCIRDMRLHAGKQDLDQPRGHAVAKNLIFAANRLDGALLDGALLGEPNEIARLEHLLREERRKLKEAQEANKAALSA